MEMEIAVCASLHLTVNYEKQHGREYILSAVQYSSVHSLNIHCSTRSSFWVIVYFRLLNPNTQLFPAHMTLTIAHKTQAHIAQS